ncbi:hypothetical protein CTEN210_03668 [Chaetoceros tenuissimus]|uniref:Uncharacterized protein n=1 Tax=Chaetoceros tenuissimus TaxID=426638 RepID=A0AAD3H210_9STRA|nr:hypothetical protein CTEN210_03668 [Chaetoceros tenuissimus]
MKLIQIESSSSKKMTNRRDQLKRSATVNTVDTFDLDTSTHAKGSFRRLSSIQDLDKEIQEQIQTCADERPRLKKRAMSCSVLDNLESGSQESQTTSQQISCSSEMPSKSMLRRSESCPDFGNRSVSFGQVEFRFHQRTAGDNPSVSDRGPAFDLEWEYVDGPCESIDDYESHRNTENPRKANKSSLRINGREREKMLKYDNDVSTRAIQTSITSIQKAKADRAKTMKKGKKYEKIYEIVRNMKRKLKKSIFRKRSR